jgi:predicted TIM-barrel fold metal-dependent hydrolase
MTASPYPFVLDADSHWSEPEDLFTRRAPAAWRDKMPRVVEAELPNFLTGEPERRLAWVFDGAVISQYSSGGVVDVDGVKGNPNEAVFDWPHEKIHRGAYDPKARMQVLDEAGIDAQVIFPTTIGLGGQNLGKAGDRSLSLMAIQIYNDAQAEVQDWSGNRLLPLPLLPVWDVAQAVVEARRVAALGARGVNMTSDPTELGGPDLASRAWDPLWQTCVDLQLPVHFHIGASVAAFRGIAHWASQSAETKLALGGAMLFVGNAQVMMNLIVSGIFDRHPDLKVVSVESGIGWIPFVLEALDYEMIENAQDDLKRLKKTPSEYFRSNMYATFWFERHHGKLPMLIDLVGEDNILFETDFPHPTCLYPDPVTSVAKTLAGVSPEVQAKIMGGNGRKLYRL